MAFKPAEIKEETYNEAVSRSPKEDDIYLWLKEAKVGFYSVPDDEQKCPQLGGNQTSCALSGKIRNRAGAAKREVKLKHDKTKNAVLIEIEK